MQRRHQSLTATLSILVLTIAGIACHGSNGDSADGVDSATEALERALAPREVRLVKPEIRTENASIDLVGEIRAFDTVVISSEVAGKVDRVFVEVGDRVAAGAPLAEVDRSTFAIHLEQAEANVRAAEANLSLAEKDFERKKDLRSDETIPQAALDQARASFELATADLAAARAALSLAQRDFDRSIVRAPSAGAVTERMVVAGQWAEVGVGLLELAVGDRIKVAARVPEAWVGRFVGLDSFSFFATGLSADRRAEVYSLQPVVREASRSYEIVGTTADDGTLKPGMFANVTLTSPETTSSLWLPTSAVATSDLPQVLMVVDDEIVYRKVQIGRRDDHMIEIVSGLGEDEQVISEVAGLTRGLPVTVTD